MRIVRFARGYTIHLTPTEFEAMEEMMQRARVTMLSVNQHEWDDLPSRTRTGLRRIVSHRFWVIEDKRKSDAS